MPVYIPSASVFVGVICCCVYVIYRIELRERLPFSSLAPVAELFFNIGISFRVLDFSFAFKKGSIKDEY